MTKSVLDHQAELLSSDEWKRVAEVRQFSISVKVFAGNAAEFERMIEAMTGPDSVALRAIANRPRLELAQLELCRLLHNYVAAAFSLVDHSRRFYKQNYGADGLFTDYERAVKEKFADAPLCRFVKDLRNYMIHKTIPPIGVTMEWSADNGSAVRVTLAKSAIADFDWSPPAKLYLEAAPNEIDLGEVGSQYKQVVTEFYEWVFARLHELHAADLEAIARRQEAARRQLCTDLPAALRRDIGVWKQVPMKPDEIFLQYMAHEDWNPIAMSDRTPGEKAVAFVDLLRPFSPPLDDVLPEIRELFEEFYAKRASRQPVSSGLAEAVDALSDDR